MRLKSYLLTEAGRTKKLSQKNAEVILNKQCKAALESFKKDDIIFRGIYDNSFKPYGIVKPSKHTRTSANTENYYTLLTANSKQWKNYPRRDQSIICSTDIRGAEAFGDSFYVFPFNGSRIGFTPELDFWLGFSNAFPRADLSDVNSVISDLLGEAGAKRDYAPISGYGGPPLSYKDLVEGLDKITDMLSDDPVWSRSHRNDQDNDELIKQFNETFGDFWEWQPPFDFKAYLEDKFDPKKNGFKVIKIGQKFPMPGEQEVWTDGTSLLIDTSDPIFDKILN